MLLEWSAEHVTEITTEVHSDEYGTRGSGLGVCAAADAYSTSCESNAIVANSRKKRLEALRRLQNRFDPTTGGRKRNLLRTIIFLEKVLSSGTSCGDRAVGILCVALRENVEGMRSSSLVWGHWCLRNS